MVSHKGSNNYLNNVHYSDELKLYISRLSMYPVIALGFAA